MSDEIAQVCQLQVQGIKFVIQGSLEAAKYVIKAIKALMDYHAERAEEKHEKKLQKVGKKMKPTGNKTMAQVMELSKDGLPQMLYLPEDKASEIYVDLHKAGVRFFIPPDLDPSDGKVPIMLPPQDMAMASAVVKPYMEEKLSFAQDAIKEYAEKIAELKEKIVTAAPEEKKELRLELDHLMQGKEEMEHAMDDLKADMANECTGSFMDYLRMGKGTEFEHDPEKAVSEAEQGVEIGKKFSIDECLQPFRDRVMMPESKMLFYVPDMGVTIEREFKRDAHAKTIYSEYTLKTNEGEIYAFSDKNYTKEEWNEKVLPKILDRACVIEKTECRVFQSEERMKAYAEYFNKVTPKSEKNMTREEETANKGFHNADVLHEAENAMNEERKGKASANINQDVYKITVPQDKMTINNGKIVFMDQDGASYSFSRAENAQIKNGEMSFFIRKDDQVIFRDGKNDATILPAKKALDHLSSKQGTINVQTVSKVKG